MLEILLADREEEERVINAEIAGFNLMLEILLADRPNPPHPNPPPEICFNLMLEILLADRRMCPFQLIIYLLFQSHA